MKNNYLHRYDTNCVYNALLHEGIVEYEDSTSKWAKSHPRR